MRSFFPILTAFISLLGLIATVQAQAQLRFDPDVPQSTRQQILTDLQTVASFQGPKSSELYKKIFESPRITGSNLTGFFHRHIEAVGLDSCGGGPSVAACVYYGPKMWLTPNYINSQIPQLYRISMIFHEARHTESYSGGWGHARCPIPYRDELGEDIRGIISGTKMEGQYACDDTVMGAYGLQAVLLKNIANSCESCSEKIKQDGELFGDDTIKRISHLSERKKLRDDLTAQ